VDGGGWFRGDLSSGQGSSGPAHLPNDDCTSTASSKGNLAVLRQSLLIATGAQEAAPRGVEASEGLRWSLDVKLAGRGSAAGEGAAPGAAVSLWNTCVVGAPGSTICGLQLEIDELKVAVGGGLDRCTRLKGCVSGTCSHC
jgi:hypothetical protein